MTPYLTALGRRRRSSTIDRLSSIVAPNLQNNNREEELAKK